VTGSLGGRAKILELVTTELEDKLPGKVQRS
jgi:hypothetical protein